MDKFYAIDRNKINDKFNITGVMAGKKNLLCVFNIPADKAVNEIKNRYGKVIFNIADATSNRSSPESNPGAKILITVSEKIIPKVTIRIKMKAKLPCI